MVGITVTAIDALDQGRESFGRQAWADACAHLSAADQEAPLGLQDLERLATAAELIGRDVHCAELLARAYHECLRLGEPARAARCAYWLGMKLRRRGEMARAGGWLARARRLIDDGQLDCVERGYLLLPAALQSMGEGAVSAAHATFAQAGKIGDRFGDVDLVTLAGLGRGQSLIRLGEV